MGSSAIDVWHGFGSIRALISHDGESGNATSTAIEFEFKESLPFIDAERDEHNLVTKLSLSIDGGTERKGLSLIFKKLAEELAKPENELGSQYRYGYDDDNKNDGKGQTIRDKGDVGENSLNRWFKTNGIGYVYINQSPETFSNLFQGVLKRPDFIVLLESVGMIAVDAKHYALFNDEYSLPLESELKRVLTFERLFRIPVWYAYMGEADENGPVWYWISALKALEVGKIRKNSRTQEEFISIHRDNFEKIKSNEDLGKLYTHRLKSLKRLKDMQ